MNQTQEIPWRRIAVEGAAIVISILLAFSIDAWWDTKQRQNDEVRSMSALLTDLKSYREGLVWNDGVYEAIRVSALTLLKAGLDDEEVLDDEQIDILLYDLSWTLNRSYYEVPTLEALHGSDLFTELDDTAIQRGLAYLITDIEGVQYDVLRYERFIDSQWTPYLITIASLPQIYGASSRVPGHPEDEYPTDLYAVRIADKRSHQNVLNDLKFQGLLQHSAALLADIFTRADGFDEKLDNMIEQIEKRITK
jgi:hypothetical protein